MATLDASPPVNLVKSIFLCNIFNFFFSCSKACLFPFLTLYLKMLGLSAVNTGIIIGMKTLIGFLFAPLWARCAVRCGSRRCMLMFSMFMMATTYLSLTAVPSLDTDAFTTKCRPEVHNISTALPNIGGKVNQTSFTTKPASDIGGSTTLAPITTNALVGLKNSSSTSNDNKGKISLTTSTAATTTVNGKNETTAEDLEMMNILKQLLVQVGIPESKMQSLSLKNLLDYVENILTAQGGTEMIADALKELPPGVSDQFLELVQDETGSTKRGVRSKREVSETGEKDSDKTWAGSVLEKLIEIRNQIRETEYDMFVVILIIVMVGEAFCSPVEKIADDGWFEFLESIDNLEKYGMQRVWSSFAYIILPIIVTLTIDNTTCLFGLELHPFMLHFYMFGGFLGLSFILGLFYPMSSLEKYKYASKVGKGMKIVFCNARNLLFTFTLFIMGIIYASYYNFLFWMLFDLGSKEITMGLCVSLVALVELPMLLFNDKLTQKIGNGGVIALSLLFLAGRCFYYSILWTPWAVIPAEITHAFTHTAMWWAVLSSKSFNITPTIGRSVRSLLSSVYFGIGFASGAVISGFVYDIYGPVKLFQAAAILSACWFPIFAMGIWCCKERDRSQVKYTRLLTSDSPSDDESNTMEDDWLEQALKDK